MSKTVQFQTIQFSISLSFKCKSSLSKAFPFQAIQFSQTVLIQFNINMQLVLFNPSIGPYPVLPLEARVDLGAIAMRGGTPHFPKLQH